MAIVYCTVTASVPCGPVPMREIEISLPAYREQILENCCVYSCVFRRHGSQLMHKISVAVASHFDPAYSIEVCGVTNAAPQDGEVPISEQEFMDAYREALFAVAF